MPVVSWEEISASEIRRRRRGDRLLVITHCTKSKDVDWGAVRAALASAGLGVPGMDLEREAEYRRALAGFVKPAAEMYGGSFKWVSGLVEGLRGCVEADLFVLSARYGLISAGEPIVPYEAALNGMSAEELRAWAAARGVPERAAELLEGGYGFVVAFLPGNYARALGAALKRLLSAENALLVIPTRLAGPNPRALVVRNKGVFSRRRDVENARRLLAEAFCTQH